MITVVAGCMHINCTGLRRIAIATELSLLHLKQSLTILNEQKCNCQHLDLPCTLRSYTKSSIASVIILYFRFITLEGIIKHIRLRKKIFR